MTPSLPRNLRVWRLHSEIVARYWWVLAALVIGSGSGYMVARIIPDLAAQSDTLLRTGAVIGLIVGIFISNLMWKRTPEYQISQGDRSLYRGEFDAALRLKPNAPMAHYYRGVIHLTKGDYIAAITDYTAAISLNYRSAPVYTGRALARYRNGNLDGALSDINTALQLKPNDANARRLRGKIYEDTDDVAQAIADYRKALKLEPTHPKAEEMQQYIAARTS